MVTAPIEALNPTEPEIAQAQGKFRGNGKSDADRDSSGQPAARFPGKLTAGQPAAG
jgi:hypothetical protein